MDEADAIINEDRPVVQDAERDNHVEIVWPRENRTTILHEEIALSLFAECLRIVTGVSPER
jgi:hypothetical protein